MRVFSWFLLGLALRFTVRRTGRAAMWNSLHVVGDDVELRPAAFADGKSPQRIVKLPSKAPALPLALKLAGTTISRDWP